MIAGRTTVETPALVPPVSRVVIPPAEAAQRSRSGKLRSRKLPYGLSTFQRLRARGPTAAIRNLRETPLRRETRPHTSCLPEGIYIIRVVSTAALRATNAHDDGNREK